eukprot:TRINITY_DN1236_c0_g1_i4.p1 TRINITY_DN1236_c0_g1~~TRINITY_DN1236_c0_g1_i4.p1  ORF type:complete len:545 (-),score=173.91 TRINITY_DN1236_c0_g1_i4:464-2011(-)
MSNDINPVISSIDDLEEVCIAGREYLVELNPLLGSLNTLVKNSEDFETFVTLLKSLVSDSSSIKRQIDAFKETAIAGTDGVLETYLDLIVKASSYQSDAADTGYNYAKDVANKIQAWFELLGGGVFIADLPEPGDWCSEEEDGTCLRFLKRAGATQELTFPLRFPMLYLTSGVAKGKSDYLLPGLWEDYVPRGVSFLGETHLLLSYQALGEKWKTPSLFVLMEREKEKEIVRIFELYEEDGTSPFIGSVADLTVCDEYDVVFTGDDAYEQPTDEFSTLQPLIPSENRDGAEVKFFSDPDKPETWRRSGNHRDRNNRLVTFDLKVIKENMSVGPPVKLSITSSQDSLEVKPSSLFWDHWNNWLWISEFGSEAEEDYAKSGVSTSRSRKAKKGGSSSCSSNSKRPGKSGSSSVVSSTTYGSTRPKSTRSTIHSAFNPWAVDSGHYGGWALAYRLLKGDISGLKKSDWVKKIEHGYNVMGFMAFTKVGVDYIAINRCALRPEIKVCKLEYYKVSFFSQ